MPGQLPEDIWKEAPIEKARLALVEKLRIEHKEKVDAILRNWSAEDKTIPDYLKKS